MLSLVAAAVLASSLPPPPLLEADVPLPKRRGGPHLGLTFDVGLPEGAGTSLTFGPWRWLRLSAGPAFNGAQVGLRGGVALVPLQTFLRPTLSVHAGTFPEGDAQGTVRFISGDSSFQQPLLSRVSYDYVSAQAGVEIGSATGTSFFLRGGVSRTTVRLPGFEDALRSALGNPDATARAPVISLTTPSVQLGLSISIL